VGAATALDLEGAIDLETPDAKVLYPALPGRPKLTSFPFEIYPELIPYDVDATVSPVKPLFRPFLPVGRLRGFIFLSFPTPFSPPE